MTTIKGNTKQTSAEALVADDRDLMKLLLKEALQEVLEGKMTEFISAQRRANALTSGKAIAPVIADVT